MKLLVNMFMVLLLLAPGLVAAETMEEYQKALAADEQPGLTPKSMGSGLISKDVIIQELSRPQPPGQAAAVVFSSELILFDYGSWKIRESSYRQLMEIAAALKDSALATIPVFFVDGHTCSIGTEENNCRLSWRRAESVVTFLIEAGQVPPGKLTARGFGEYAPIASNESEEGRRTNRRVVLKSGLVIVPRDQSLQCSGSYR